MPVPGRDERVWQTIGAALSACTKKPFSVKRIRPVSGGCINSTIIISNDDSNYFVKLNSARYAEMFAAEADGLRYLSGAHALRVPMPLCCGSDDEHAWLVLEKLGELDSKTTRDWRQLGRGLASMHRHQYKQYGWHRDNTIGSTPQRNHYSDNWIEFVRNQRIGYQLGLADKNCHDKRLQSNGRQLLDRLPQLLADHDPAPSLLHGDLWSGNIAFCENGQPVVFDPAVYYGDRETDVAMTELFGGFPPEFYNAYNAEWPLETGYRLRKHLYNLYHLLNHLNLFGGAYLAQCQATIDRLLAHVN
ncbi:MAG: fructosamine kinase family protein [Betaproteobacteria bacterium]|jgi:fructosamine-3-kinase|nr:MAG: fructosamine kinase family protein [Betaproteobacteria bacterium]